jgi:hypothetical protein
VSVEDMLISSRKTCRGIVVKGEAVSGQTSMQSVAREVSKEARLLGRAQYLFAAPFGRQNG